MKKKRRLNSKTPISLVVPVFNEENRIEKSLREIHDFMERQDYDYEVIVSDDGSQDSTKEIVKRYQKEWKKLKLIENKHKGKSSAIIAGINSAVKEYVLFTDVDLSVSIDQLSKMIMWLKEKDYDVAVATREGVGSERVNEPYIRHFMGRVFNLLVQLLVLPGMNDTQCGFKAFKTDVAKDIFKYTKIYSESGPEIKGGRLGAYDVEMLFVARRRGYRIKEVPVVWVYGENSKVHKLKDSYINLMDVLKIRINSTKGYYPPCAYESSKRVVVGGKTRS